MHAFSPENNYYHHGVYLGDQLEGKCQVLHFSGADKDDAKPRICDILEFFKGAMDDKVYRVDYENIPALPVEQIAETCNRGVRQFLTLATVPNRCQRLRGTEFLWKRLQQWTE